MLQGSCVFRVKSPVCVLGLGEGGLTGAVSDASRFEVRGVCLSEGDASHTLG